MALLRHNLPLPEADAQSRSLELYPGSGFPLMAPRDTLGVSQVIWDELKDTLGESQDIWDELKDTEQCSRFFGMNFTAATCIPPWKISPFNYGYEETMT